LDREKRKTYMTKEELAQKLNDHQYRQDFPADVMKQARVNGLVVMFGYSDDLLEMRGALEDEIDCYDGDVVKFDKEGFVQGNMEDEEDDDIIIKMATRRKNGIRVQASNDKGCWVLKTKVPHAKFNIMDEGELQCEAIVFSLKDL
jgi:hypothetical protein